MPRNQAWPTFRGLPDRGRDEHGDEMEEHWTAPKGNSMVGLHRDVGKGRTLLFEFLRIEQQGDQIVYPSMPNGRSPATPFPLKEVSGTRVVFENPHARFSAAHHLLEGRQRFTGANRGNAERQDRRRRMALAAWCTELTR